MEAKKRGNDVKTKKKERELRRQRDKRNSEFVLKLKSVSTIFQRRDNRL